jgi:O-antigen/teichoic acid export membrane protein
VTGGSGVRALVASRLSGGWGRLELISVAGAGVLIQVLNLVSGPLVARLLGPHERGVMVLVMVLTLQCSLVGVLGLPAAIAHRVGAARAAALDVVGHLVHVWFLWAVVPALASVGLTLLLLRGAQPSWGLLVGAFVVTLQAVWLALVGGMLQGEGNVRHVNAIRLVGLVAYVVGVAVVFVLRDSATAVLVLLVYALAQAIGLVSGWRRLQPRTGDLALRAPRAEVHDFAKRSFVSSMSVLDSLGLDMVLVGLLLGATSLGLYQVALSATNLPVIVLTGVASLLLPRMAALRPDAATLLMRRWLLGGAGLAVLMVVGLELIIGPAIRIAFGTEFVPATWTARIFILAWALMAMRRLLAAAAQAQNKAGRGSLVELAGTAVLLVGVVTGLELHGIEGAACGVLAAGVVSCALLAGLVSWRAHGEDAVDSELRAGGRTA